MSKKKQYISKNMEFLIKKINKSKAIIVKERDKLRELYYDLESTIESLDEGLINVDSAMQDFGNALDRFSEHL